VKLIGSKMEKDFRHELVRSNEGFNDPKSRLKQVLESAGHSTEKAYVLHWTPDQTEDLYSVLIDGAYLVSLEIDKFDSSILPVIEHQELKSYSHGLSRMYQVQQAVALDLTNTKT
jgi:hypothetical protein